MVAGGGGEKGSGGIRRKAAARAGGEQTERERDIKRKKGERERKEAEETQRAREGGTKERKKSILRFRPRDFDPPFSRSPASSLLFSLHSAAHRTSTPIFVPPRIATPVTGTCRALLSVSTRAVEGGGSGRRANVAKCPSHFTDYLGEVRQGGRKTA